MAGNDPIDESFYAQARVNDGLATGQGVDDDNMGEEEVAQPSEYPGDLGVDHQDQSSSSSKSKRQASLHKAEADLDDTASLTQQDSHDSPSSPALRDALNKAEAAIFDAYKDLVAHISSFSNDGERDDLLTSALSSIETAMKSILVAQAAAGDSAQTQNQVAGSQEERGAVERSLGVLPPTTQPSQPRDEATVASTGPRREEQATQALPPPQGSSAPQSGSTSKTSESSGTAKSTAQDAQTAAPEQPTKSWPDGWVELHANLQEALSDLLSVRELPECKEAREWEDHVTALRPGAVIAAMSFFNENNINGTVDPNNVERGESCAHEGWDLTLDRIHRNTPLWKGRALHIMKEGNPYEPMLTRWKGALPTILRSVTSIPKQHQQDGVGTSAQPTVE